MTTTNRSKPNKNRWTIILFVFIPIIAVVIIGILKIFSLINGWVLTALGLLLIIILVIKFWPSSKGKLVAFDKQGARIVEKKRGKPYWLWYVATILFTVFLAALYIYITVVPKNTNAEVDKALNEAGYTRSVKTVIEPMLEKIKVNAENEFEANKAQEYEIVSYGPGVYPYPIGTTQTVTMTFDGPTGHQIMEATNTTGKINGRIIYSAITEVPKVGVVGKHTFKVDKKCKIFWSTKKPNF